MTPPSLTAEQRRDAYEKSLELRQARAMLKETVKIGALTFGDAWSMELAQGMKVFDLLVALPGIARAKALRLMLAAGIPERNTVRACGPKQTQRLFEALR